MTGPPHRFNEQQAEEQKAIALRARLRGATKSEGPAALPAGCAPPPSCSLAHGSSRSATWRSPTQLTLVSMVGGTAAAESETILLAMYLWAIRRWATALPLPSGAQQTDPTFTESSLTA